jgi:hypothetical protein
VRTSTSEDDNGGERAEEARNRTKKSEQDGKNDHKGAHRLPNYGPARPRGLLLLISLRLLLAFVAFPHLPLELLDLGGCFGKGA